MTEEQKIDNVVTEEPKDTPVEPVDPVEPVATEKNSSKGQDGKGRGGSKVRGKGRGGGKGRGKGRGGGKGRGKGRGGGKGQGKGQANDPAYQDAMSKAEYQLLGESTWTSYDIDNAIEERRYVINSRTGQPYQDVSWTVSTSGESDIIKVDGFEFSRDRFFRNPEFRERLEEFYTNQNLDFQMKPVYPRHRSGSSRKEGEKRGPAQKWVMTFYF